MRGVPRTPRQEQRGYQSADAPATGTGKRLSSGLCGRRPDGRGARCRAGRNVKLALQM